MVHISNEITLHCSGEGLKHSLSSQLGYIVKNLTWRNELGAGQILNIFLRRFTVAILICSKRTASLEARSLKTFWKTFQKFSLNSINWLSLFKGKSTGL